MTRVCPTCERWHGWELYGAHPGGCECRGCVRACWGDGCAEAAREREVVETFWLGVTAALRVRS